jgi:hypothetical protein
MNTNSNFKGGTNNGGRSITGILGYLQSQFEFRKFVPHRYFAYATLSLASLHVYLNWGKIWRFLRRIFKGK